jgi:hypothetical protein
MMFGAYLLLVAAWGSWEIWREVGGENESR